MELNYKNNNQWKQCYNFVINSSGILLVDEQVYKKNVFFNPHFYYWETVR